MNPDQDRAATLAELCNAYSSTAQGNRLGQLQLASWTPEPQGWCLPGIFCRNGTGREVRDGAVALAELCRAQSQHEAANNRFSWVGVCRNGTSREVQDGAVALAEFCSARKSSSTGNNRFSGYG